MTQKGSKRGSKPPSPPKGAKTGLFGVGGYPLTSKRSLSRKPPPGPKGAQKGPKRGSKEVQNNGFGTPPLGPPGTPPGAPAKNRSFFKITLFHTVFSVFGLPYKPLTFDREIGTFDVPRAKKRVFGAESGQIDPKSGVFGSNRGKVVFLGKRTSKRWFCDILTYQATKTSKNSSEPPKSDTL